MSYLVQSYGKGDYVASEAHTIYVPGDYLPDATKRGAIFGHSRGGDATQLVSPTSSSYATMRAIAEGLGLPIMATDAGGTDNWGNSTAVTRIGQTATFLRGATWGAHATDPLILFGQSMGAVTVLNWALGHLSDVACVVLFIPVLNVSDVVTNNRGGLAASVNSAYGGAWSEGTHGATSNPVTYAASLAGVPIQIWYANNDTTAIPGAVTAFDGSVGASCEIHDVGALGHTQAAVDAVDVAGVLAFIAGAI